MAEYSVSVTRDCTESAVVRVEASSAEEAISMALVKAAAAAEDGGAAWCRDDGSEGEALLSGFLRHAQAED